MTQHRKLLLSALLGAAILVALSIAPLFVPDLVAKAAGIAHPLLQAAPPAADENPFIPKQNSLASEVATPLISSLEIIGRLLLAVVLSGILAFRPRKNVPLFRRSLYVSQTQILLAVVAAALMLIVGDNTARAFAIFAAVSLVRFRTNIRDPKEITVLLISLALGLGSRRRTLGPWDSPLPVRSNIALDARV